jgi:hypothetical protein
LIHCGRYGAARLVAARLNEDFNSMNQNQMKSQLNDAWRKIAQAVKGKSPLAGECAVWRYVARNRRWVAAGVAAAVLLTLLLMHRDEQPSKATKPAENRSQPVAASTGQDNEQNRRRAWERIVPRLEKADQESAAAIDREVAKLDVFFGERKRGARPFAEEILGLGAKVEHGAMVADQAIANAARSLKELLLGKDEEDQDDFPDMEDAYTVNAQQMFERHVCDPLQVQRAVQSSIAGYLGELKALESRVLVDLRADLDDSGLTFDAGDASQLGLRAAIEATAGALSDVLGTARTDLGVVAAREGVSWVAGNKLGDALAQGTELFIGKLVINGVAGMGLDKMLGSGIEQTGYDPETEVSLRAAKAVDAMRNQLVDGQPEAMRAFQSLRRWRDGYPDSAVRRACGEAIEAIERRGALGLRPWLRLVHEQRVAARRTALFRLVTGKEVHRPPTELKAVMEPRREAIIKYAQDSAFFWTWGVAKP